MAYPGNPELSTQAQERVIAAFRQVIAKLQEGQRDEALIGLEFVLRLDPAFAPATTLHEQLSAGTDAIDLGAVIGQLQAPSTDAINELLVEAVEAFNNRDFLEASEKVKKVLGDLPGHQEARGLQRQIDDALKVQTQVGNFLAQAREALDGKDPQEAANFVMMAQALDPLSRGIDSMLREIQTYGEPGAAPPTKTAEPATAETAPPEPPPPAAPPAGVTDDSGFETVVFETSDLEVEFEEVAVEEVAVEEVAVEEVAVEPEPVYSFEAETDEPAQDFFVPEDLPEDGDALDVAEPPPSAELTFGEDEAPAESPIGFDFDAEDPPVEGIDDDLEGAGEEFSFGVEDEPPPVSSEVAAPDDIGLFDDDSGDVADLFDVGADEEGLFSSDDEPLPPAGGDTPAAAALLDEGQSAFDSGDFQTAIEVWSRIYAVDPSHEEAAQRIDEARRRLDETMSRVELMVADASDAEVAGEKDTALELARAILAIQPENADAVDIIRRIEPGAAAAPSADSVPPLDIEEDIFQEDLPDLPTTVHEELPVETLAIPDRPSQVAEHAPKSRGIPWRPVIVGVAAVLVISVGALLGTKLLGSGDANRQVEALNRTLEQAQALYEKNQAQEAIHLLQQFEASELDRERIERRIKKYEEALAPPTPTPIPQTLIEAEKYLNEGQWMAAYGEVTKGLEAHPQDMGLMEIRERVLGFEPQVATLHAALAKADFRTAAHIAESLTERHPNHEEFAQQLSRSLYNAALADLRTYNLTAAEVYLNQLDTMQPGDEDVTRILDFVSRYKARPVDMQLEIFIGSLSER